MEDNKIIANKAKQGVSRSGTPNGKKQGEFVVVKEYCGIEKGTLIDSSDKNEITHMVKQGYWKAK